MTFDSSTKATGPAPTRSCKLFAVLEIPNDKTRMIETTTYRLKKMPRAPGIIPPTWRLTKLTEAGGDSEVYTVHREQHGSQIVWHCTCMDALARRTNTGDLCKHASALQAMGLFGDDLA